MTKRRIRADQRQRYTPKVLLAVLVMPLLLLHPWVSPGTALGVAEDPATAEAPVTDTAQGTIPPEVAAPRIPADSRRAAPRPRPRHHRIPRPVDPMTAARLAPAPAPEPCPPADRASAGIFLFPNHPVRGQEVRVVVVAWKASALGALTVELDGKPVDATGQQRPNRSPYVLVARFLAERAGQVSVRLGGAMEPQRTSACATGKIAAQAPEIPTYASYAEVWPVTRQWNRWTEALFSAWVARLFYVSRGGQGGWLPLHQVTRDPSRNWLYNARGWKEDEVEGHARVVLLPDCADLPYFLRAYFSWKLGLPFAFQRCTRGNAIDGPICPVSRDNLTKRYAETHHPIRRFNQFIREWVGWGVHSGTTRTVTTDNSADFYPVALNRRALRPGRIFVDPAGHVFVLSQRRDGDRRQLGVLFGVDAHPDRTISRKRFARGTFVFDHRYQTGGFKAFRPVVYEKGHIRRLTNAELASHPEYRDFSSVQTRFAHTSAFYAAVQKVLNPYPVDPVALYRSKIHALYEATQERVTAVSVGVQYMQRAGWRSVPIPKGPAIFETTGPWERYSTPARDLRLLMAIQDVLDFPRDVVRHPALYRLPKGWSAVHLRRELRSVYDALMPVLQVSYHRSDGTVWTLSLNDIVARREALRMGYHPNDCPEIRWGAAPHSKEARTCTHRAPQYARDQMRRYEVWFQLLRRPTLRG